MGERWGESERARASANQIVVAGEGGACNRPEVGLGRWMTQQQVHLKEPLLKNVSVNGIYYNVFRTSNSVTIFRDDSLG